MVQKILNFAELIFAELNFAESASGNMYYKYPFF